MKRILVVAPHADDEVLGAGGTIAKNVAEGNEAYICVVTRGAEPLFSKTLTEQVREETIKAHKLLGIKETYFLEYPAVMLENIERYKLNESILQVVQKIKPDEVYIPHMGDMQKDHQIVNEAVMVAVPGATAVTTPLASTLAMLLSLVLQERFLLVAFSGVTVA